MQLAQPAPQAAHAARLAPSTVVYVALGQTLTQVLLLLMKVASGQVRHASGPAAVHVAQAA